MNEETLSEEKELAERLSNPANRPRHDKIQPSFNTQDISLNQPNHSVGGGYVQWQTGDGRIFIPARKAQQALPPGVYEVGSNPEIGLYFHRIQVKTEGLLRFPQSRISKIVSDVQTFWEKKPQFDRFGVAFKRGVLLWGPPGSGKSSCVQLIMRDVINRGGVVIKFDGDPGLFAAGFRAAREIQPETPIVTIMEDIDDLLARYSESQILNILDGAELVDRVVFLATTNYPELLGDRIVNRPSRFDRRYKIGFPDARSRRIYLDYLAKNHDGLGVDFDQWVRDTPGLSLAHLKELFVAVVIMGDPYDEVIEMILGMERHASSADDGKRAGFRRESNDCNNW